MYFSNPTKSCNEYTFIKISYQQCSGWNASLTQKQMCRGTPNSQKGFENESPPTVIGEEEIDIKSDLWKDEDSTLIHKNGR